MANYLTVSSNDTLSHKALPGSPETLCGRLIADELHPGHVPDHTIMDTKALECDICEQLVDGVSFVKETIPKMAGRECPHCENGKDVSGLDCWNCGGTGWLTEGDEDDDWMTDLSGLDIDDLRGTKIAFDFGQIDSLPPGKPPKHFQDSSGGNSSPHSWNVDSEIKCENCGKSTKGVSTTVGNEQWCTNCASTPHASSQSDIEAPDEARKLSAKPDLVKSLKKTLADVFVMYFRTHGSHWNVKGPDFEEYHSLFDKIAGDVYDSIDPLAENLLKLGSDAPSSLAELEAASGLKVGSLPADAVGMVRDVLDMNKSVLASLNDTFTAANAQDTNEQGVANYIAERIDAHQKWQWQLSATLGEKVSKVATNWLRDGTPVENGFDVMITTEKAARTPFLDITRVSVSEQRDCPDCEETQWVSKIASCYNCDTLKCRNCMDTLGLDNFFGTCKKCAGADSDFAIESAYEDSYPDTDRYLSYLMQEDSEAETDTLFLPSIEE